MAGVSALLGSVAPVSGEVSWVHNQRKISRRSYVCPTEVATWSGSGSELGSGVEQGQEAVIDRSGTHLTLTLP